ncbi:MAG: tetratricopeptide repeat protein [Smithella sp.]
MIYIILTAVTIAVYWQVHHFEFINFDDVIYITENPMIQSGISLNGFYWAFGSKYFGLWNPLVWLSFMVDHQLYGLQAGGYHVTNLILHILSTLLLFWLFHRMTGAVWKSAFVAAFFALHPLHVESVAWVSERKDVLSAFFWMLTLCLYVYYTEKPVIQRYLLILFSFVLALLSKPMVITLPVIMILLDYWPLNRFESQKGNLFLWQLREKLPFVVLSIIVVLITYYTPSTHTFYGLLPLETRLANAPVAFVIYLVKTFWPHNMTIFYPFPSQIPVWKITGSLLFIIVSSLIMILKTRRLPYLFVGWFWFIISIAPAIGIIQIGDFAMTDRYHYLPSIGISIMLAWGIPFFIRSKPAEKQILFPLAMIVLMMLTVSTWKQCGYWKNSVELWKHAINVTQNNFLAYNNLAIALFAEGKNEEAIHYYNKAITIKPLEVVPHQNKAIVYTKTGQYNLAIDSYSEAIRIKSDNLDAYYNRGTIYHQLGRYQPAVEDFSSVIRLQPDNSLAYFNRGNAYINLGRYPQAIDDFSTSISLKPDYADAYNNRAFIYLSQKRYQEAIGDYSMAISLKPDYADAYNNRAFVYLNQGNRLSGCRDAKKACALGNCQILQTVKDKGYCQ